MYRISKIIGLVSIDKKHTQDISNASRKGNLHFFGRKVLGSYGKMTDDKVGSQRLQFY